MSDFTALENVYLACLAAGDEKLSAINKAKNILKKVGLSSRLNHYLDQKGNLMGKKDLPILEE